MAYFGIAKGRYCLCSLNILVSETNEAEVLAIVEPHRIFSCFFHRKLIVKSYSSNTWVSSLNVIPWKFHYFIMEINHLVVEVFRY